MPLATKEKPSGAAIVDAASTAVIYLRVSSSGQLTGHSKEGYSIEGQREACERHAERLGARIIGEYVEPGRTATNIRRPALQRMLSELAQLRPSYVIFYDLSRVAREELDAFWLLAEIKRHGAKLESTLEHIADDDTGMLIYTILAGVNAHRSRSDGKKVKMGLDRKFADGGTHGVAPIGYLNIRDTDNGKEVRSVAIDPERAALVQLGFEAFATGDYSITTLREMLEEIGLRTRATARRPAKPLSRNGVYKILRDDYYIGIVTRDGVKREGRHEAIINPLVFEKVQRTLAAHRLSGDRTKKHAHYLKGSIFCGCCGRRLVFGRHRGNGGVYEYFSCLSYQARRPSCGAGHLSVDGVERAIERYYRTIEITPAECADVRRELNELVRVRLEVARKQSEQHKRKLRDLQNEQQKLLQLYYRDGVDAEVLQAEQERIEAERTQSRRWIDSAAHEAEEASAALDEALSIIQNCHATYLAADPELRRLMNQAIFTRLLVRTDTLEGEEAPVYAQIHSLGGSSTPARTKRPRNGQDPLASGGLGSNVGQLVRPSGLEPPRGKLPTRPSTLRVYQFRHGRRRGEYSQGLQPAADGPPACRLHPSTAVATVRTHVRRRPSSTPTGRHAGMDLTKRQQEIFDFIRKYSAKYGYPPTVRDIGKAVGLASSSTVHAHLANLEKIGLLRRDPSKPRAIELLDRAVGSAVDSVRGMVRAEGLPLLGSVAAGQPMLAEENIEDYVSVPEIAGGGDGGYLLRIRGDSMKDAGILEGDFVVVHPQDTASDGEVVVALLGEEATVKRFFREPDHIRLQPENEAMEPIRSKEVKVLGRVVGLLRAV
jgi:SOS regulatory protein LexA